MSRSSSIALRPSAMEGLLVFIVVFTVLLRCWAFGFLLEDQEFYGYSKWEMRWVSCWSVEATGSWVSEA